MICVVCGIFLGGGQLEGHCRRPHGLALSESARARILEWSQANPELPTILPSAELVPMIQGIPIYDGWSCRHCCYFGRNVETVKKHLRQHHQIRGIVDGNVVACKVQRLQAGRASVFFGVSLEDNEEPAIEAMQVDDVNEQPPDAVERALERLFPGGPATLTSSERALGNTSVNQRQREAFLARVSWDRLISRYGGEEELLGVTMLPVEEDRYFSIIQLLELYLLKVQAHLLGGPLIMAWYIGSKYSKDGTAMRRPFSRLQEQSTIKKYTRIMARLFCMLIRQVDDLECCRTLPPLDQTLSSAVQELMAAMQVTEMNTESLMEVVTKVGIAMFCRSTDITPDHDMVCPITRFLIISSILPNLAFLASSKVTEVISGLQYWGRSFMFEDRLLAYQRRDNEQSAEFSLER